MGYFQNRPPPIKRSKKYSSWAAALESWSRSTRRLPTLLEADLAGLFGDPTRGGLSLVGMNQLVALLRKLGVRREFFESTGVDETRLNNWIRASHVLLMWQTAAGSLDWHAWLIYGSGPQLSFMDPRDGRHRRCPVTQPHSSNGFCVFWLP